MKIPPWLLPYVTEWLSGATFRALRTAPHEWARRVQRHPHRLHVVLRLDDPYSYLLLQVLPSLRKRFEIEIQVHTIQSRPAAMVPAPHMWSVYARRDAAWLAAFYGLRFPHAGVDSPSNPEFGALTEELAESESDADGLEVAQQLYDRYWLRSGTDEPAAGAGPPARDRIIHNEAWLKRHGHYASATIFYQGEWYEGLDRLKHLERRLIDQGLGRHSNNEIYFDRHHGSSPLSPRSTITARHPLELFYSVRSPYSYIALERSAMLCRHYNCKLIIKPVLPMLMRDLPVPRLKVWNIFHDAKREASYYGIAYGRIADPLGPAVERVYALFEWARSQERALEFLLSCGRGFNAEGIRGDTDRGLQVLVERAGLAWRDAKTRLNDQRWRGWAQDHLEQLLAAGLWGVPTFRYGTRVVWGQDRLGAIEQAIVAEGSDAAPRE